jgi:hypothetical protein
MSSSETDSEDCTAEEQQQYNDEQYVPSTAEEEQQAEQSVARLVGGIEHKFWSKSSISCLQSVEVGVTEQQQ